MKLKNLLLLGLLVSSFEQGQLWAVQEFKEAVVAANDAVPVLEAGEGTAGGAESSAFAEGPLAKLELLRGQLTGAPVACQGATLVHGAMLWEFGIVKSLYTLLIAPKEDEVGRLVAGEPIYPLGEVLEQLFYLAGATFTPTMHNQSLAYKLTPRLLGELYAAFINRSIDEWTALGAEEDGKIRWHSHKTHKRLKEQENVLKASLIRCYQQDTPDVLNPQNLCPSIIMAYFWAKYVMRSENVATARANIAAFNAAGLDPISFGVAAAIEEEVVTAPSPAAREIDGYIVVKADASLAGSTSLSRSLDVVEAEVIARIEMFYKYDIPKPPIQGTARLANGRSFPDCGESGLRGLFEAIFYNKETQRFIIPEGAPEGFYDDLLVQYFKNFPTKDDQNRQVARNAWGAVISGRPAISYQDKEAVCDMGCDFKNVMCMLAQLVPGVYKNLSASCGCSLVVTATEVVGGAGGAVEVVADGSLPAQIEAHFKSSSNCSKKMLEALVAQHNLFLSEYNSADNKTAATWKLSRTKHEDAQCFLVYTTRWGHMGCQLEGTLVSTYSQIYDPILGGSDALSFIPQNPDMIQPLIFAAVRMAQQQDFIAGYVALLPFLKFANPGLLKKIKQNIAAWGLLTPENKRVYKQSLWLNEACVRGLTATCRFLLEREKDLADGERSNLQGLLFLAVQNGFLPIVKYLCDEQGAAVDQIMHDRDLYYGEHGYIFEGRSPLILAAARGHLPIVRYLCEEKGVSPLVSNENAVCALWDAASAGKLAVVTYLCERQLPSKMHMNLQYKGVSLLVEAAREGHLPVVKYLCEEQGAQDIDDAFMAAAAEIRLPVLQYLMFNAAMVKKKPQERSDLLGRALVGVVQWMDMPIIKYLCEQGANIYMRNDSGETVLDIAKASQSKFKDIPTDQDVIAYLESLPKQIPEKITGTRCAIL